MHLLNSFYFSNTEVLKHFPQGSLPNKKMPDCKFEDPHQNWKKFKLRHLWNILLIYHISVIWIWGKHPSPISWNSLHSYYYLIFGADPHPRFYFFHYLATFLFGKLPLAQFIVHREDFCMVSFEGLDKKCHLFTLTDWGTSSPSLPWSCKSSIS